jgi:predicted DNA-binding transcriptional regulator AlpA
MSDDDDDDPFRHLRFLTIAQICELTGYTPQHLYRRMREGTFPNRRRLGANKVGVLQSDFEAWVASLEVVEPTPDEIAEPFRAPA